MLADFVADVAVGGVEFGEFGGVSVDVIQDIFWRENGYMSTSEKLGKYL